jgi:hypothetical protein
MVIPESVTTHASVVRFANTQKPPGVILPPFVSVSVEAVNKYSVETSPIVTVSDVVTDVSVRNVPIGPVGPVGPVFVPMAPHPVAPSGPRAPLYP